MKIKIYKNNDPTGGAAVYLYNELPRGEKAIVKPLTLTMEIIKEGATVEPTFRMPEWELGEFLKSMAELAEEMGIKTDKQLKEETKTGGVLDATKEHLNDLRFLLKIPHERKIHSK